MKQTPSGSYNREHSQRFIHSKGGNIKMNYKLKTGFKKLCARAEGTNNANTNPAGIYLLKGNNRNTRTRCEICLKLIKTLALLWRLYF